MPSNDNRPDQAAEEGQIREKILRKLYRFSAGFKGMEKAIFEKRWLSDSPLSLEDIGARHRVSRETVRTKEKEMMARLIEFVG